MKLEIVSWWITKNDYYIDSSALIILSHALKFETDKGYENKIKINNYYLLAVRCVKYEK